MFCKERRESKKNYVETFFGDLDSAIQFSSTNLKTSELISGKDLLLNC